MFCIMTRFRLHPYVLTADIEKMYRQVRVHPDDRRFQQILWRYNVNEFFSTFELNSITTLEFLFKFERMLNLNTHWNQKSF